MENKELRQKILIIHGPNMNLLGLRAKKMHDKITLDKLNRHIKIAASKYDIKLKIIQSNDEIRVVNILHNSRNKVDGIILFPGPWQNSGHVLFDTLKILSIPYITVSLGEKVNILIGESNIAGEDLYKSADKSLHMLVELIQAQDRRKI